VTPLVVPVDLGPDVGAAVTGRDARAARPTVGDAGNLSHRRPHRPSDLAAARRAVGTRTGTDPRRWHLLHQVHGRDVAVVTDATPPGAELRQVDAAVTALADRVLTVQTADCVPVLFAGARAVGVAHAGRAGVVAGVVAATLERLAALGDEPAGVRVVVGPAIGGCCYEVPGGLRDAVAQHRPTASATTTWGTPSLDLPRTVVEQLTEAGVEDVRRIGGCTRCDPDVRWFSHRADPSAGRQLGLIVRRPGRSRDEVAA
jgi:polyphenol oxidase